MAPSPEIVATLFEPVDGGSPAGAGHSHSAPGSDSGGSGKNQARDAYGTHRAIGRQQAEVQAAESRPPATTAIIDALPKHLQNVGSAVNGLVRELGGTLGIAVLSSLLNGVYRDHLHPTVAPVHLAEVARSSLTAATTIGGPVLDPARAAFTDGLHTALRAASGTAAVAPLAAALLRHPHGDGSES